MKNAAQQFTVGQLVSATMTKDSFYKKVVGTVISLKNGFVEINATLVMSKWDKFFKSHPTSCNLCAKVENVTPII